MVDMGLKFPQTVEAGRVSGVMKYGVDVDGLIVVLEVNGVGKLAQNDPADLVESKRINSG